MFRYERDAKEDVRFQVYSHQGSIGQHHFLAVRKKCYTMNQDLILKV
jgi:hypothetical protein